MPAIETTSDKGSETSDFVHPSTAEVLDVLENYDWAQYWKTVGEESFAEIEAYRKARTRYLETASQRVFG